MTAPTYLFAGGGSGGHLFPGVAVAEELRRRDPACRIVFAGSERGIEPVVLSGTGFGHVPLPVLPPAVARRRPDRFAAGLWRSTAAANRLIDELRPAAVIGLGGFASVPLAVAAKRRGVRLVLLEQNVVPGRATSWLARLADHVCVSFAETAAGLPRRTHVTVTGNPVRSAIAMMASGGRQPSGPPNVFPGTETVTLPVRPTLLILGGSQGAAGVNRIASGAIVDLRDQFDGWRILHQTGARDEAVVRAAYRAAGLPATVQAFFADLPTLLAGTDLCVTRAGATTLAELACAGMPSVLVPYPGAVRDHQRHNADRFAASGAAVIVPEGPGDAARCRTTLAALLADGSRRTAMAEAMSNLARPHAAAAVADLLAPAAAIRRAA